VAGLSAIAALFLATGLVVGDGMPQALTGTPGDATRGRAIVLNRQLGLCLLCHSGPFPEERTQATVSTDLGGTGRRWNAAQLRLRVADNRLLNPDSLMPSFHRVDSASEALRRVDPAFRGKPVLDAQQVEDVVAFLLTLRD
jgi:L-cysteine S-thiosulfotransferase